MNRRRVFKKRGKWRGGVDEKARQKRKKRDEGTLEHWKGKSRKK